MHVELAMEIAAVLKQRVSELAISMFLLFN